MRVVAPFLVTGRLIFISLLAWLVSAIPVLGIFSGIFTLPFALVYTTVLYLKLSQRKDLAPFPRARTLLSVALGALLIPALLAFRLAFLWPQLYSEIKNQAGPFLSSHWGGGFQ